ncbi:MAG: (2Fe-2S)-binding protein [Micavibrio sp.]
MFVCSCNPFNDKAVKECLSKAGDGKSVRVADVYRACSGGAKPQCGSCLPTLKAMVTDHNNAAAVNRMKDALPPAAPAHNPKPNEPVG